MKSNSNLQIWKLPALVLMLLLTACSNQSPIVCAGEVNVPTVPPLPQNAQQPPQVPPCLPTCLDGLTVERESWRKLLTDQE